MVRILTYGCKANQADSERMRQALEAAGWAVQLEDAGSPGHPEEREDSPSVVLLNTCTVTARADAEARRGIRRIRRTLPEAAIVVAGCSASVHPARYGALVGAERVVRGHDPTEVVRAVGRPAGSSLVRIEPRRCSGASGIDPLRRRVGGTRGWLSIQDGCDRRCSFCATRIARGGSRSRPLGAVVEEARALARHHPELALTGIHIGHYGRELATPDTLAHLVEVLLSEVPGPRLRLGSIEATEVDDALLDLLVGGGDVRTAIRGSSSRSRLVPHLHMPLQSGSDRILRAMRRWHTRDDYRRRTLEIAEALSVRGPTTLRGGPVLGLGADLITGFPGETDADHQDTVRLVEELPFTYLHVFPFSPREGTAAAELAREHPVPQRVAAERARELRELGQAKGEAYLASRVGARVEVVVERARPDGSALGLTEDYLRLPVRGVEDVVGWQGGKGRRGREGREERGGGRGRAGPESEPPEEPGPRRLLGRIQATGGSLAIHLEDPTRLHAPTCTPMDA